MGNEFSVRVCECVKEREGKKEIQGWRGKKGKNTVQCLGNVLEFQKVFFSLFFVGLFFGGGGEWKRAISQERERKILEEQGELETREKGQVCCVYSVASTRVLLICLESYSSLCLSNARVSQCQSLSPHPRCDSSTGEVDPASIDHVPHLIYSPP